ncbi:MAG TPA: protein phosphatase 2C domain-containing protein [Ardenticatenaceae bacterium]|nr:protein phosphatase 2C domain-containing protein [Ardenticatenaceae bacterium]
MSAQPQITMGVGLDVGRGRAGRPNQDSLGTYLDFPQFSDRLEAKGLLFMVADGMGGAAGGQEASETAVRLTIQGYYQDSDASIRHSLARALQSANEAIYARGHTDDPDVRGMGTTAVIAVIRGDRLVVGNVGDSRASLLRGGTLRQMSADHSWVQEQVRHGVLTPEQAVDHPRRNVILRNLGNEQQVRPDFVLETPQVGDVILLCSDGVWGEVRDEEIAEVLRTRHPGEAARTLVRLANEYGGSDNIAAVVLRIDELPPRGQSGREATTTPSPASAHETELVVRDPSEADTQRLRVADVLSERAAQEAAAALAETARLPVAAPPAASPAPPAAARPADGAGLQPVPQPAKAARVPSPPEASLRPLLIGALILALIVAALLFYLDSTGALPLGASSQMSVVSRQMSVASSQTGDRRSASSGDWRLATGDSVQEQYAWI